MAEDLITDAVAIPTEINHPSDEARARFEEANQQEQRGKLEKLLRVLLPVLGMIIAVYTLVLAILFLLGWTAAPLPFAQASETEVEESTEVAAVSPSDDLSAWSDEELAAQLVMVTVPLGNTVEIQSWASRGIGGILLVGDNAATSMQSDIAGAQDSEPLGVDAFIAVGGRCGDSSSLNAIAPNLASEKKLSKLKTTEVTEATRAAGLELQSQGVNVVFGPAADLTQTGAQLAKAERTFVGGADKVAQYARAWSAGMNTSGVGTVLKHWPGLGGYADVSQVVTTYRSWADSEKDDVRAFDQAVDGTTTMVLVGHVIIPDLTEPGRPASVSKKAMEYLRGKVGDTVILLSDDTSILKGSNTVASSEEAAVMALQAGADMVLCNPVSADDTTALSAITDAISSGAIARADAEAKVARILSAKTNLGLSLTK